MYVKESVSDLRQQDMKDDIDMKRDKNCAQYVQNF